MKNLVYVLIFIVGCLSGFLARDYLSVRNKTAEELIFNLPKTKPFEKYAFENLSTTDFLTGDFSITNEILKEDNYESDIFEYTFYPALDKTEKITTGQINFPIINGEKCTKCPVVLMFRGYINQEGYRTGDGTRNGAKYFAQNGFITIAPDFLGYGGSSQESGNIFETRFQTYVTAISILKKVISLKDSQTGVFKPTDIFIWGHSNGGQIALTTLEITGVSYPTTLWAPVSKPFPYSVLFYTDESDDRGKLIRSELSDFEDNYDVDKYSLDLYLDRINAPVTIQQGSSDEAVPIEWTKELNAKLKKLDKTVNLFVYPETDHNMRPSWNTVVERDVEFFRQNIRSN